MRSTYLAVVCLVLSFTTHATSVSGEEPRATSVVESERGIPVAYTVDVVVVGGSTGAVSAAVAAADEGASVFLAAPYPYLGEDMTATLRLWLGEDEEPRTPLARKVFEDSVREQHFVDPARVVPYRYETSLPSAGAHPDTRPATRLHDGKWGKATDQSVQYDDDVTITLHLSEETELAEAHLLAFHANDFLVDRATVSTSLDGRQWKEVAVVANAAPPQSSVAEPALKLSAALEGKARHVRVSVKKGESATRVLLGEIFLVRAGEPAEAAKREVSPPPRPLHVKRVLDDALLEAGVQFLYSAYATDVVLDGAGRLAGVVIANRAGRQAVVAKCVVDATEFATVARLAGAEFAPFSPGERQFTRVVVGGAPREGDGVVHRIVQPPFWQSGTAYDGIDYLLEIPLADGGWASWAEAEQVARDRTYDPGQQFPADRLFTTPRDRGPLRGVSRLHVLGGRALERSERALRPVALMELGERIGKAAAREARSVQALEGLRVPGPAATEALKGEVREPLVGVRPVQELPTVPQLERALPVIGHYDVVVIGGGTSGAPAGIGAARRGAKTLVVEYLHGLGGVGTQGAISSYYWGNRVGFSASVYGGASWAIEEKMEWWRRQARDAGADIWFGCLGCGAFVDRGRVRGAVVVTPMGRGVVLADVVIDSTGNADIASAAGAATLYTDASDIAMQGTGLPPRRLGTSYTNTDFTIVDETDMVDVWSVFVYAKRMAGDAFDLGRLIDTRERRRIVGDRTISILDELNGRTYPDTVTVCYSDFDTHGYTTDPYFTLQHPPAKTGFHVNIPYGSLVPRGLDGILVTGLGISAHRDAIPLIRMQADVQNQGYAAGVAAAMIAASGSTVRDVDLRALQKHLIEIENLPERVLTDTDSYPIIAERVATAVDAAGAGYDDMAAILTRPDLALPLLRRAYEKTTAKDQRLVYAQILAVLGDDAGVADLIAAVQEADGLDEGWRYKGMGQFGPNMSPLDRLLYALGRAGDRRATGVILDKLKLLDADREFSHFRAMTLALEMLGDAAAAEPLSELLQKSGLRGHAMTGIDQALERARKYPSWTATEPRSDAIRELLLGRALYRCGDKDGLGKQILQEYVDDLRGHLSRHAKAVLESRQGID